MSVSDNLSVFAARGPAWELPGVWFCLAEIHPLEKRIMNKARLVLTASENDTSMEPTFSLDDAGTQRLFDQLWDMGFRPADGTGNSGHIAALKYHLEDLRKLVFK